MTTFSTSLVISAPIEAVFAAFADPVRLERWWGPKGFTNTFDTCDFKVGGRWSFVMHGPDGKSFPNESVFEEIQALEKIVIRHVSPPKFRLTVQLATIEAGTQVSWTQEFEDAELAKRIAPVVVPANEQNLFRLACVVVDWSAMRGAYRAVNDFIADYKAWNDAAFAECERTNHSLVALEAAQAAYAKLLRRFCLPDFKARPQPFSRESRHDPAIEKSGSSNVTLGQAVIRNDRWINGFRLPGDYEYHLVFWDYRWWLEQVYYVDGETRTESL